jgi:hypothetical protein
MELRYGVHGPKEIPQNLQQDFKLSKRLQQKFIQWVFLVAIYD